MHCIFSPLQVPDETGERGGPQPTEPTLPCHPDTAGPTRRGPWERHRAHSQRDQPPAAMGGELGRGTGAEGRQGLALPQGVRPVLQNAFSLCSAEGVIAKLFPFQNSQKSET